MPLTLPKIFRVPAFPLLVLRPLKNTFFCGFPNRMVFRVNTIFFCALWPETHCTLFPNSDKYHGRLQIKIKFNLMPRAGSWTSIKSGSTTLLHLIRRMLNIKSCVWLEMFISYTYQGEETIWRAGGSGSTALVSASLWFRKILPTYSWYLY